MCILLIEDEWLIMAEIVQALEGGGYEVASVFDGEEALAIAPSFGARLTAIVTDLHVPGLVDGRALVETMRGTHPDIPMVMATANPDALPAGWLAEHRVRLLPKPYLAEDLVDLMRTLVSSRGGGLQRLD